MTTFRFWGVRDNGERDLVGFAKGGTIAEAIQVIAMIPAETLSPYGCVEIERDGFEINALAPR